jgi:glycosyltransferase involved in cell wall biosynthesis
MKISICLPVMGRPRMLAQALHSILAQGYEDTELVIKDGDPANPVCLDADVSNVSRCFRNEIQYEVGKDAGIFAALNNCLARATGDILYFMCSDDLLCPGAFQTVNSIFEKERFGGAFWVYGKTISADETGKTLGVDGDLTSLGELLQKNRIGQPSVFWNRAMLTLAGNFDTRYRYTADYDMWLRFWKHRQPLFVEQTLGVFRHHEGSTTQMNSAATDIEAAKVSMRHQQFSPVLARARNRWVDRRAYEGDAVPLSHDELQKMRVSPGWTP